MAALDPAPIVAALDSAAARKAEPQALLQLAADRIRAAGAPYTSVYMYMLHDDELVLEAFAGRETEHTRIMVGHGVCGSAVATGTDQVVGDVQAIDNYIACNLWTKSELVVLIRRGDLILGQIDVDSDQPDPFTADEVTAVRTVADGLAGLL